MKSAFNPRSGPALRMQMPDALRELCLEAEPQCQLNLARRVHLVSDLAEAAAQGRVGYGKLRVVEEIEELAGEV